MDALACALERARPDSLVAREGLVLSIWQSSARTGLSGNPLVRLPAPCQAGLWNK
jgi:hypothetical protein